MINDDISSNESETENEKEEFEGNNQEKDKLLKYLRHVLKIVKSLVPNSRNQCTVQVFDLLQLPGLIPGCSLS